MKQAEAPGERDLERSAAHARHRRRGLGHHTWAIPGGHVPLESTGEEPRCTSRDQICILNTSRRDALIDIMIYYVDRDAVGPFRLTVPAERTRHIRVNDLIDPEAIPLDVDYAAVVQSSVPIVVQFERVDTSRAANALIGVMAHPIP
jgi:hypothetical protein